MRRDVALVTEALWAQGRLCNDPAHIQGLAQAILARLAIRYPHSRIHAALALQELRRDIHNTLRVLTYGGRQPMALSPQRRQQLQETIFAPESA